jgi:hypothetical protein
MEKRDSMKTRSTPEELSEQIAKRANQWQWVALVVVSPASHQDQSQR